MFSACNNGGHSSFSQRGIGMIEVLVTLFVLSIGLLGAASLQFVSSFNNADALNRSQSVMVAQQLSERLRASTYMSRVGDGMVVDNTYFDNNIYNFKNLSCGSGALPYQCFCQALPAAIPDCRTNSCTQAQVATFDAYEMSCAATSTNPSAELSLSCVDNDAADTDACSSGSRISVILAWPVENWQKINRVLNADCNVSKTEPHDCVVVEMVL